jgi:hypothetical protein
VQATAIKLTGALLSSAIGVPEPPQGLPKSHNQTIETKLLIEASAKTINFCPAWAFAMLS